MKLSQVKRIIKEEIKKAVKEAYDLPTQTTPEQFVQAVTDMLPELRKQVDAAASAVKVVYVENSERYAAKHTHGTELKVQYDGIKQANKLANAYNEILFYLDGYAKQPSDRYEEKIRAAVATLK